ncbi:SMP-30/gluconolactonase/LRE family protein [Streptomyces sp. NPDC048442]|uniref:SMP-30/gluconolactonase/LRE family protein n=1 Tax=Streptomyces sp. NPDC048442 TaxID=3154823 RepID=UPI003448319A
MTPTPPGSGVSAALRLFPLGGEGPEHVTGDGAGGLLTGVADGRILRVDPATGQVREVADTGGRPMGMTMRADGTLLVCDAERGLLEVDLSSRAVRVLLTEAEGEPLGLCSNVAEARNGTVYVTDSSTRYGLRDWKRDLLEHVGTGRLIRLAPDGCADVLIDALQFANGVVLTADESYAVVAESGGYRLLRVRLDGAEGQHDVLADELPGFPDNLTLAADGLIWVALAGPRDPLVDLLHRGPAALRRTLAHLPPRLLPGPRPSVRALALTPEGRTTHDVRRTPRGFRMATSAYCCEGRLWFGSLRGRALAATDLLPPRAPAQASRDGIRP